MLDVLAIAATAVVVLLALVMTVGLDQQGQGGESSKTWFSLAFLLSIVATIYGVRRTLQDGPGPWLAVTAFAPLTMLALLVADRDALWGNFPPSAPMRAVQRVAAVAVMALPGLLAYAAAS